MHFPLGVRNSGIAGLPMPSRSSFLLALDRQERGEEGELENWVFLSLFPELQPGLGAHQQPPPVCLPSALGTAWLAELGEEMTMPSEVSAIFSEWQIKSPSLVSWPLEASTNETHTWREQWAGPKPHQAAFQKQLAQTDLVPITAPQLALIRVGPASAQAQGTSWLSATPQGGAHIEKQCKHSPFPIWAPA